MSLPLVTVTLLNWNDRRTIFAAIDSVANTRYPNLELIFIDNASSDGTPEEIERRLPEWTQMRTVALGQAPEDSWFSFIRNKENIGFAKGHNKAIERAHGEYIVCLNADAMLTPTFVEEAQKSFADNAIGAVQGNLLRYDFQNNAPKQKNGKPVIDTTGLLMFKNRRIVNRGQGDSDTGQFEKQEEVLGPDGAVPVYRKKALDDIAIPLRVFSREVSRSSAQNSTGVEFFDENFFLYKEDVDLAWRLRLLGWKTIYTPKAVAYHSRGSGDSMAVTPWGMIRERRKINPRAKFYSFRNQRLMQLKNELPGNFVRHLPWLRNE